MNYLTDKPTRRDSQFQTGAAPSFLTRSRKDNAKRTARAGLAFDLNRAAMELHDVHADRQTETRAASGILRREEGLEQAALNGVRHARAGIDDLDEYFAVVPHDTASDRDAARLRHRMLRFFILQGP